MDHADFWLALDKLISESNIVIDRPKGSTHPKHDFIYEVDYGYLENTASMDGSGIDVWMGTLGEKRCDAIICTIDLLKKDSEVKLLIGYSEEEKNSVMKFHNGSKLMKGILLRREIQTVQKPKIKANFS